jgi:hypothetical protein
LAIEPPITDLGQGLADFPKDAEPFWMVASSMERYCDSYAVRAVEVDATDAVVIFLLLNVRCSHSRARRGALSFFGGNGFLRAAEVLTWPETPSCRFEVAAQFAQGACVTFSRGRGAVG